jgi:hypothetical protein
VRRAILPIAALVAATLVACGAPSELSEQDGVQLDRSRDRVLATVETERRLSESRDSADRLIARVRKVVSSGALEARQLDEFGLAALGELHLAVPGLVVVDGQEVPRKLNRRALTTFLAEARDDPAAATEPAAAHDVSVILGIVDDSGADASTEIPVASMTVDVYLADLAARMRPLWPDLAAKVSATRSQL